MGNEETGVKINKSVCIHPLARTQELSQILANLAQQLKKFFSDVTVLEPIEPPNSAFNNSRKQFNSTELLKIIEPVGDINLGVLDEDIYSNALNFVFGEAEFRGNKAVISVHRLRPQFYGHRDVELLKKRVLKEAMHEIGHVLGLRHCSKSDCVMHFSNSIRDTDVKGWCFCEKCLSLF